MRFTPDLSTAAWRKSSYSNNDGGVCVEVADGFPSIVPVRDSKNPQGPALVFPTGSWSAILSSVRTTKLQAGHGGGGASRPASAWRATSVARAARDGTPVLR